MSLLNYLRIKWDDLDGEIDEPVRETRKKVLDAVEHGLKDVQEDIMETMEKIKASAVENPEQVFRYLRVLKPILVIKEFALVTRYDDVQEVLTRDSVFSVIYEKAMRKITDGENFFLGMQPDTRYSRDQSNMRTVVRRDDLREKVIPVVAREAERLVAAAKDGKLDAVWDLTRLVPARLVAEYFGFSGEDERSFIEWNTNLFNYLFIPDIGEEAEEKALEYAALERVYLDDIIQKRKDSPDGYSDILARCLEQQQLGLSGWSDLDIRNNLIGLIVGAIPTTSKAAAFALDVLLDRPRELVKAQEAASKEDQETVAKYVFEALRFKPHNSGVFRLTNEDYTLAKGTTRATKLKKGTTVLAATQSAMFDRNDVQNPDSFRLDRPPYEYMHYGYGVHTCFGEYINQVQIPGILLPLLKQKNLRRAEGDAGKLQMQGAFPTHLNIEFDV